MNIQFNLDSMSPTELAALYVLLTGANQQSDRQKVWFAGVANCGENDFRVLCKEAKDLILG